MLLGATSNHLPKIIRITSHKTDETMTYREHSSIGPSDMDKYVHNYIDRIRSKKDNDLPIDVNIFLEEILNNLVETDIRVKDILSSCGIGNNNIYTKFKHHIGVTPKQYILLHRIELSKVVLKKGMSISEVALSVGFGSPSSFTRAFRKREGVLPSEYVRKEKSQEDWQEE